MSCDSGIYLRPPKAPLLLLPPLLLFTEELAGDVLRVVPVLRCDTVGLIERFVVFTLLRFNVLTELLFTTVLGRVTVPDFDCVVVVVTFVVLCGFMLVTGFVVIPVRFVIVLRLPPKVVPLFPVPVVCGRFVVVVVVDVPRLLLNAPLVRLPPNPEVPLFPLLFTVTFVELFFLPPVPLRKSPRSHLSRIPALAVLCAKVFLRP